MLGWEESARIETSQIQPSGMPSHRTMDPMPINRISSAAMTFRLRRAGMVPWGVPGMTLSGYPRRGPVEMRSPGLGGPAVRAGDRRGDVGLEDEAARARV